MVMACGYLNAADPRRIDPDHLTIKNDRQSLKASGDAPFFMAGTAAGRGEGNTVSSRAAE